jgi:methionyl-tRNA formyltransferase
VARVGFAGTSAWAADALRGLHACPGIEVALALTQPDRPAGRGKRMRRPAVADAAGELGIELVQPERPQAALAALRAAGCEAMACVAYGELVPRPMLDALPWLNLHPSLLPRWRGAAPIERALMAGEEQAGVAVILLVEALDAGPVAALERFAVGPDEVAGDVYERALELGLEPLARALAAAAAGTLATVPQVGEPTYAHKLTAADRELDATGPARALHDRVRALSPHVGARLGSLTLWRTRSSDLAAPAGELVREGDALVLGCGDGAVEVLELQSEGRRRMVASEWLRGARGLA